MGEAHRETTLACDPLLHIQPRGHTACYGLRRQTQGVYKVYWMGEGGRIVMRSCNSRETVLVTKVIPGIAEGHGAGLPCPWLLGALLSRLRAS